MTAPYLWGILVAPLLWVVAVAFAHGYEARFTGGVSAEEYRALVRAAVVLVAVVSVAAYSSKLDIARGYVVVAVPSALVFSLCLRWALRRSLARRRARGFCLQRAVVVGRVGLGPGTHPAVPAGARHGMHVVAACVSGMDLAGERVSHIGGVPVIGFPDQALSAVDLFDADVVAVLGPSRPRG